VELHLRGAPADFVVYDRDPLADLGVLDHPAHVVLNGRRPAAPGGKAQAS
jgi:imidazolonepropionase-like amidohydrolase